MRRVCALALGLVACGHEVEGPGEVVRTTFGAEGGALVGRPGTDFEGVRIDVPPGALDAPVVVELSLAEDLNPLPPGAVAVGPTFQIRADVSATAHPVRVTLPFWPDAVREEGQPLGSVKVWRVAPEGWTLTEPVEVAADQVAVELSAFTAVGAGLPP